MFDHGHVSQHFGARGVFAHNNVTLKFAGVGQRSVALALPETASGSVWHLQQTNTCIHVLNRVRPHRAYCIHDDSSTYPLLFRQYLC